MRALLLASALVWSGAAGAASITLTTTPATGTILPRTTLGDGLGQGTAPITIGLRLAAPAATLEWRLRPAGDSAGRVTGWATLATGQTIGPHSYTQAVPVTTAGALVRMDVRANGNDLDVVTTPAFVAGQRVWTTVQLLDSYGVAVFPRAASFACGFWCTESQVIAGLTYIGTKHLRIQDDTAQRPTYASLVANYGARFLIIAEYTASVGTASYLGWANVDGIECTNEVNNPGIQSNSDFYYGGQTDVQKAAALRCIDTYANTKAASPTTPVLANSFVVSTQVPFGTGDESAFTDLANAHGYITPGQPPSDLGVAFWQKLMGNHTARNKDVVSTEFGILSSTPNEEGQAIFNGDMFFDTHKWGTFRTYFFSLSDSTDYSAATCQPGGDPKECYFGLGKWNPAGTWEPKLTATWFHNINAILNAVGSPTGPAPMNTPITLSGLITGDNVDEYAAAYGPCFALWYEGRGSLSAYNASTSSLRSNPHTITLGLPSSRTVDIYDPLLGTSPQTTVTGASIAITLDYHPLLACTR